MAKRTNILLATTVLAMVFAVEGPARADILGGVSQSADGGDVSRNNNAGDSENSATSSPERAAKSVSGSKTGSSDGINANIGNSSSIGNFAGSFGGDNTASGGSGGTVNQSANGGTVSHNNNAGESTNNANGSGVNINALNSSSIGNVAVSKGGTNVYSPQYSKTGKPGKPGQPCGNCQPAEWGKHPMGPLAGMSQGQLQSALGALNQDDLQTMKRSCGEILASRTSYDDGTVQVCEVVTALR